MTTQLAIFDFDGTLADTYPIFSNSLNGLAVKHGFKQLADHELAKCRGLSAAEVLRELRLPLWKAPAVLADVRKIMRQRIGEIHPFQDLAAVLHALHQQRIELAVTTSNSIDNVRMVLGDALLNRFAAVECGASLFGKSHRLRRILKKMNAHEAAAIYIGDEIRDAEAAEHAGLRFGAVAWGYTHIDALLRTKPHRVFHSPADLLSLGSPKTDLSIPH
ncbi:HAD hydrolase-like protein [Chromobacterium vaccinii]|uniref:HAD hydrolase-like protein n=1 Tax=Chromobacterium vaccinii TaxID=1108595 RepID=A0ABV0FHM4_9NEIS